MKPKKNKKADLNRYTNTFMLIGLVVSLFVALMAINLKTEVSKIDLDTLDMAKANIDETKVIKIEEMKPKPQKRKPRIIKQELKIIKDESKKAEDNLLPTDPDNHKIIALDSIDTDDDYDEPDVPVIWTLVERVPTFPGCKGNNEQLKKCLNEKIGRFVSQHFNAGIAEDLGLSGERVRIITMFTIDKNGQITDIKTRSKYKDLEKEARRVIKKLPKMQPGKQRDRAVNVTYTLPIVFNVE